MLFLFYQGSALPLSHSSTNQMFNDYLVVFIDDIVLSLSYQGGALSLNHQSDFIWCVFCLVFYFPIFFISTLNFQIVTSEMFDDRIVCLIVNFTS